MSSAIPSQFIAFPNFRRPVKTGKAEICLKKGREATASPWFPWLKHVAWQKAKGRRNNSFYPLPQAQYMGVLHHFQLASQPAQNSKFWVNSSSPLKRTETISESSLEDFSYETGVYNPWRLWGQMQDTSKAQISCSLVSPASPNNFLLKSIIPLLMGGCLALMCDSGNVSLAQEQLPPVPINPEAYTTPRVNTPDAYTNPQMNTAPQGYTNYQAAPSNQYNQNQERYLVFVDSNNYQVLEQVRLIEPRAYIRQIQGRSIIQVGVFSKAANAQQRLNQLTSSGINGAGAVNLSGGQPTPNNPNNPNNPYNPNPGNPRREESSYYYVAIPANSGELASIQDKIRRNLGQSAGVIARNHPLGSHIAVGPFAQRLQAEQWNNYLRNLGFGNARVYYGK